MSVCSQVYLRFFSGPGGSSPCEYHVDKNAAYKISGGVAVAYAGCNQLYFDRSDMSMLSISIDPVKSPVSNKRTY